MDPVTKVTVTVHGRKDFPLHFGKLPEFLVKDLPELIQKALQLNPATSSDDVIRAIWRLGSSRLRQNMARGISPLKEANNPLPPVKSSNGPESDAGGDGDPGTDISNQGIQGSGEPSTLDTSNPADGK